MGRYTSHNACRTARIIIIHWDWRIQRNRTSPYSLHRPIDDFESGLLAPEGFVSFRERWNRIDIRPTLARQKKWTLINMFLSERFPRFVNVFTFGNNVDTVPGGWKCSKGRGGRILDLNNDNNYLYDTLAKLQRGWIYRRIEWRNKKKFGRWIKIVLTPIAPIATLTL